MRNTSFRNCGVSGERTDEIARRLARCAKGADVLLVQGGINDIAQGRTANQAAAGLRRMVVRGKAVGLRVGLVEVSPWNNGYPRAAAPIRELNSPIRRIGREEAAPVLPWYGRLEDPTAPGRMKREWTADGDHPSVEGYRRLAAQWVDREVVVVDVGAHTGEYAIAARSAFGDRMTLHCFEPCPETFATLQARVGDHPRTTCHRLALGDEPGVASLFSQAASSAFTSLHAETFSLAGQEISRVAQVEVQTLDNLAAPLRLDRIDLLKVDVEGHELAVLKGAHRLLEAGSVAAVQFEYGERNLASRSFLLDFVELLGAPFGLFRVTPFGLRPLRYSPAAEVFVLESNYLAAGPELREALRPG